MKKLFSSALSLLTALVCISGNGALTGYADAITTTYGTFNGEAEELLLGDADDFSFTMTQSAKILSESSGEYLYRDFLDDNNLAVYDALTTWVTPSEDPVTVELPTTAKVTLSALPGTEDYSTEDEEAFKNAIFENSKPALDSLFFDTPEIFWLDTGNLSIGVENASYTYSQTKKQYTLSIKSLKFTPAVIEAYGSVETALLYKEKLETAVETYQINGDTCYDQLKSIHDSISLFTYYDLEGAYQTSAVGSLLEPGVVCEGYSKGMKILCDNIGIPCVLVFGNYDATQNIAHMWNYVQMEDGNWYAIDLTWDDTDGSNGQEVKYAYFLKGSDNFFLNHTEEADFSGTIFTYPEISTSDYQIQQTEPTVTTTTTTCTLPLTTTTTTTTTEEPIDTATTTTTTTCTVPPTTTTTTTTTEEPIDTATTTTTTPTCTVPPTTTTTTTMSGSVTTTTVSEAPQTTTEPVTTTTTAPEIEYDKGDLNCDGEVNVADLVLCSMTVLGEPTSYSCDFNEDGLVDCFDLLGMRVYILSKLYDIQS